VAELTLKITNYSNITHWFQSKLLHHYGRKRTKFSVLVGILLQRIHSVVLSITVAFFLFLLIIVVFTVLSIEMLWFVYRSFMGWGFCEVLVLGLVCSGEGNQRVCCDEILHWTTEIGVGLSNAFLLWRRRVVSEMPWTLRYLISLGLYHDDHKPWRPQGIPRRP